MFFQKAAPAFNTPVTIPSPIGGLNSKDSIIAMDQTDALTLLNWWPQSYGCSIRKGYQEWATGLGAKVNAIHEWASVTGARKLFAWAGANMYDVTTQGAVGAAMVTGLTGTNWVATQLTNSSGNNLIAVNGVDNAIIYKPTGVFRLVAGDGIVANTWAGLDPAKASQVIVHQHRLWAVEKNTSNGWFLPPDALQGTFLKYDFGPLFNKGGYLAFLATWTLDSGSGSEDHLVALSSNGEAVVYGGTDPTDSTKWALTGVYYIGAPVSGRVGFCKAGGDLLALTQQGIISMSEQLISTQVKQALNPLTSYKIQFLVSTAIGIYSGYAGWDIQYLPKTNMLLINVPSVTTGGTTQFAANQITSAWTIFTGMDASCWGVYNLDPMFGTADGKVMAAWTGNLDNVLLDGTGGTRITAEVQQAYTYFGKPTTQKQVGLYQPVFTSEALVTLSSTITYDFVDYPLPTSTAYFPTVPTGIWDTSLWGTPYWGGGTRVQKNWVGAEGMGIAASLRMVAQSTGDVLWVGTNYSLTNGSGLF
jgi:hypothetical protein